MIPSIFGSIALKIDRFISCISATSTIPETRNFPASRSKESSERPISIPVKNTGSMPTADSGPPAISAKIAAPGKKAFTNNHEDWTKHETKNTDPFKFPVLQFSEEKADTGKH